MRKFIAALSLLAANAMALPIDWHGELEYDTTRIEEFRRIESTTDNSGATGSQELPLAPGDKSNASFQSYLFKLKPEIIINDSTTIKGELSTGYGYGGIFGEDTQKQNESATATSSNFQNALYLHDTTVDNKLNLNRLYAVFYADTATYKIGRHAAHWGLGALHNNGEQMSSRHATIRDGMTVDFKIGNFKISPYYSKISSGSSLTKATRVKESGVALFYNNIDRELSFGILYSKNKASNYNSFNSDLNNSNSLGITDVKITDLYFKKTMGNYSLEVEVPLLSGEIGHVYNSTTNTKLKAKAILIHQTYKVSNRHIFNLNVGKVSGDSGNTNSFDAMYLNPNYQIANILFRYNLNAVSDSNQSIYDSYITNTLFLKFAHTFETGQWNWTNSFIWARAEEVAKKGTTSFNHQKNKQFAAAADQEDDYGMEFDSNITFKWNTAVTIGGNFGYLKTGDFFAFNNTNKPNVANDSFLLKAFTNISF